MIEQITILETCWFLSPPWCHQIPAVEIGLLERVYIKNTRSFGFCCGFQWRDNSWLYTVASDGCANVKDERSLRYLTYYEIIGTGRLESTLLEQPAFVLGERVMLRTIDDSPRMRLVLGAQLLNESWSYYLEWMSPALEEKTNLQDRLALVPQKDLVRVMF